MYDQAASVQMQTSNIETPSTNDPGHAHSSLTSKLKVLVVCGQASLSPAAIP
jgi:hypothetical protein